MFDFVSHHKKPKVAFFDFACCEGCQVELTNFGDAIFLQLLQHIELVEFREIMSEKTTADIDIACIEGSFTRAADRDRLESIRQRSHIVIAYGQCAVSGGINALKNHQPDYRQYVYSENADQKHLQSDLALPVSAAIKVDFSIYGCPINRNDFIDILSHIIHGKQPVIPNYPVCVECKRNNTPCRFTQADYCLGMLARAGCQAPCPADGIPCEACRGFIDQPNQQALLKALTDKAGMQIERASASSQMFNSNERNGI